MIIEAVASNRVGDFGGWADTWFARTGAVVNFAVDLFARVTVRTRRRPGATIYAQNFGDVLMADGKLFLPTEVGRVVPGQFPCRDQCAPEGPKGFRRVAVCQAIC